MSIPRIVIAGTHGGVGKTTVATTGSDFPQMSNSGEADGGVGCGPGFPPHPHCELAEGFRVQFVVGSYRILKK